MQCSALLSEGFPLLDFYGNAVELFNVRLQTFPSSVFLYTFKFVCTLLSYTVCAKRTLSLYSELSVITFINFQSTNNVLSLGAFISTSQ